MREPLQDAKKRLSGLYRKPFMTVFAIIIMAFNLSAQTPSGTVVEDCTCLSNQTHCGDGQYSTLLRIVNGGLNNTWYVAEDSIQGLYDINSPAPPAPPIEFVTGPAGVTMTNTAGETYELTAIHVDSIGYWVNLTDGTDTVKLFVSPGTCKYPRTKIVGDPFVCEGQVSDYSTANNATSNYLWTLNNDGVHGGTMTSANTANPITIEWDNDSDGKYHQVKVQETDANGCIVSDSMLVQIEDTITMACTHDVQISLDANCAGALTADMFLEGQVYNDSSYAIIIQDSDGNLVNQDTLSKDMVNKVYTITVQHLCSGNMCWSYMLVLDKSAPDLNCHTDTIKCSDSVKPEDLVNGFPLLYYTSIQKTSNPYKYIAKGTSGCSDVTLVYSDEVTEEPCSSQFTSTIIRTWRANDASLNSSVCIDTIRVERTGLADISYPVNWDGLPGNHPFIQACSNYTTDANGNPDPSVTGAPSGPFCGNLMVNYSDKRLYLCNDNGGKSYKVLRNWIVMDMCTGDAFDTLQIIAIMDTRKPAISIPGLTGGNTFVVNTEYYNCGANVELPVATVRDCSIDNPRDYSVGYQLADDDGNYPDPTFPYTTLHKVGGKYILPNIPYGFARIKYTATDPCGNTRERIIYVKVKDNLPPQAVCDKHTTVTLSDLGTAYLSKYSFDDGSFDNCSEVTLDVRRMTGVCDPSDLNYGEGVHFCCIDSGQDSVGVELRVTDSKGFTNSCMAWVIVSDNQKPSITCPSNGEVSCKFDYSDLSVFGTIRNDESLVKKIYINDPEHGGNHHYFGKDGYASDNCDVTAKMISKTVSINNCGTGVIRRVFQATDSYGNKSNTCTQTIRVKDFKPFNANNPSDLRWPLDYTFTGCLGENILPDNLPERYGWPKILGDDKCSTIAMDYDDLIFEHVEGTCYKIIRTWRVVDWCVYEQNKPGTPYGYWEHVQTIMVTDDTNPTVVSGCTPVDITALGNCDYRYHFKAVGDDNCTDPNELRWSYKVNIDNSATDVVEGNTDEFNIVLSKGTHKITWYVEDNCGNIGQCSKTFTVKDEKAPTPQCIDGLVTVVLPESGKITIHAADFNRHSTDDCTRSNYGSCGCLTDLTFSFSDNRFEKDIELSCADIKNGIIDTIPLTIWVWDESHNGDFCNTYIVLQDNNDACPDVVPTHDTIYYQLAGIVQKPNESPLEDIKIVLTNENPEFSSEINTNANGEFVFEHLADNSNYKLTANRNGDYLNGVSTLDIVLLQKHLLGIKKFKSPYDYIAADVNNSKSITASDILEIRKLILGRLKKFSKSNSWKFIDKDKQFEDIHRPFGINEVIDLGSSTVDINKNLLAIKVGDINQSAVTGNGITSRSINTIALETDNIAFEQGDQLEVKLAPKNAITTIGSQFTLEFNPDKLSFNGIESDYFKISDENINRSQSKNGLIMISIDETKEKTIETGKDIFTFNFTAKENGVLDNLIKISSRITKAEIYTIEDNELTENNIKLEYRNSGNFTFKVFQNIPNPFSSKTIIGFEIPNNESVSLKVYDMTGKVIYQIEKDYDKGYNEIKLTNDALNVTGLLYYELEAGEYSAIRKMILIK